MNSRVSHEGEKHRAARASRDWSKIFTLPTVGGDGPCAPTPEGMRLPLYEYQQRSLARMLTVEADGRIMLPRGAPGSEVEFTFRGGVIADEVGMGKTAQLIALFLASPGTAGQPKNLVVTPGHLCGQWANEIRKFAPSLRVASIEAPIALGPNARQKVETGSMNHDVVITSLEVILGQSEAQAALFGLSWRRIVYDECHEVIALSDPQRQSMLENLAQRSRNVWCVSGTPFPHHDASMYGIHQLLGVKYKMHIVDSPFARNKPLDESHPFQKVKRRFYLKNTPASVGSEWEKIGGRFSFRVRTTSLDMTLTERGFYDEQYRKLQGKNGYGKMFIPLRQLCDHPAACKDWADALQNGSTNQPLHTLDDLRARFIEQKEKELEQMSTERARKKEEQEAARHSTTIVNQLNPVVQNLQREDLETGGLVTWPDGNPNYRLVNMNGGVNMRRRHVLKQWLLHDMASYEARRHFLNVTAHWLKKSDEDLTKMAREEEAVRKELSYFQNVLKELEPDATSAPRGDNTGQDGVELQDADPAAAAAASAGEIVQTNAEQTLSAPTLSAHLSHMFSDKCASRQAEQDAAAAAEASAVSTERECIICSGTDMTIVSMAPCGHYFCTTCLQKWLVDHGDCPTCRKPIARNDVMWIHLSLTKNANTSLLTRRFGTKPAALVQFIQAELTADRDSRFIVFSMWHAMLKLTQGTLEANGIQVVSCDSKTDSENAKAIETFRSSPTVRVIMLSMEHAAAGTNLQAANHVILLEPPGVNPAHGVAQETQAIGRAARLGQERVINITRFVINETIEAELHKQNHDQRMASESGRRFACDNTEDDQQVEVAAAAAAAAAAASPGTIAIVCAITPPEPSCFEVEGASALPHRSTEPIMLSTDQVADGTATVSEMRASLLLLARQHLGSLSAGCTLSLYFAGRQLTDEAPDGASAQLGQHNIQSGSQLHGVLRPPGQPTRATTRVGSPHAANQPAPSRCSDDCTCFDCRQARLAKERAEAAAGASAAPRRSSSCGANMVADRPVDLTCEDDDPQSTQLDGTSPQQGRDSEETSQGRDHDQEHSYSQEDELAENVDGEEDEEGEDEEDEDDEDEEDEGAMTAEEIDELRVVDLRAELKRRGLLTSGRRAALLSRLKAAASTGRTSSIGKRRRDSAGDSNASPAASPISTPHGSPDTASEEASAAAASATSEEGDDRPSTRKRQRSAGSDTADAAPSAAESATTTAAEPGGATAATAATAAVAAAAAAPTGSRHCDREAALRNVIAMGFTPQRAARLQKTGASPGSDGVGNTEKLLALLLGDAEPAGAAAAADAAVDLTAYDDRPLAATQPPLQQQPTTTAAAAATHHGFHSQDSGGGGGGTISSNGNSSGLQLLADMGFSGSVAERTLKAAGGDVQEALSRLLYRASVL